MNKSKSESMKYGSNVDLIPIRMLFLWIWFCFVCAPAHFCLRFMCKYEGENQIVIRLWVDFLFLSFFIVWFCLNILIFWAFCQCIGYSVSGEWGARTTLIRLLASFSFSFQRLVSTLDFTLKIHFSIDKSYLFVSLSVVFVANKTTTQRIRRTGFVNLILRFACYNVFRVQVFMIAFYTDPFCVWNDRLTKAIRFGFYFYDSIDKRFMWRANIFCFLWIWIDLVAYIFFFYVQWRQKLSQKYTRIFLLPWRSSTSTKQLIFVWMDDRQIQFKKFNCTKITKSNLTMWPYLTSDTLHLMSDVTFHLCNGSIQISIKATAHALLTCGILRIYVNKIAFTIKTNPIKSNESGQQN